MATSLSYWDDNAEYWSSIRGEEGEAPEFVNLVPRLKEDVGALLLLLAPQESPTHCIRSSNI